jgi:hypothetical protein
MKKVMIGLFAVVFAFVLFLILNTATKLFKPDSKPTLAAKKAEIAYYKAHNKAVGQAFFVDSIQYKVNSFAYSLKTDTTILVVDITIENKTNYYKNYANNFFIVKGDAEKIYYPTQMPFTVFENRVQPLKLIYILPQKVLPYLLYHLYINSQKDSMQNGMITLYKNYRAEG